MSAKKKARGHVRTLLHSVSVLVNFAITSAYLLSVLSVYISPDAFVLPAFFGLAFPFLLAAQIGMVGYWILRTRVVWIIGNALLLLITWGTIDSYTPLHRKVRESAIPDERIKVMTYNVKAFDFKAHSRQQPNPILKYIKGCGADIICLQEARLSRGKKDGYVSRETFRRYLPEYPHIDVTYARGQDGGSCLILLSKFPIVETERIAYESLFNGSVAYTLMIRDKRVLVVNNHLESFRMTMADGEDYMKMARDGEATALSRQMTAKMGPAYALRAVQADSVSRYISRSEAEHIIVCGDFNDTPVSYTHHHIGQGLRDAYADTGYGPGFTFNHRVYKVRIDHIFYSPTFLAYNCTVDRTIRASDHYPVWCYLVAQ